MGCDSNMGMVLGGCEKEKYEGGGRAAGEGRLECTSYYKGERADEVMNGCMRGMNQLFALLSNYVLPHAVMRR